MPPLPPAAHSFFEFPREKNHNGNWGRGRGRQRRACRGVGGFIPPAPIVGGRENPPRAGSARHHFVMLVKGVRAKASSSPQKRTSRFERAAPRSGAALSELEV